MEADFTIIRSVRYNPFVNATPSPQYSVFSLIALAIIFEMENSLVLLKKRNIAERVYFLKNKLVSEKLLFPSNFKRENGRERYVEHINAGDG